MMKHTNRFRAFLKNLPKGECGMTGLETAIILIAFVTVAAVLAYSVLSAGIFTSERGKETIYTGLEQAQSSLEIKGAVIGYSDDNTRLATLRIKLGLVDHGEQIDSSAVVITYFDDSYSQQLSTSNYSITKVAGSVERGASAIIERDEIWEIVINVPLGSDVLANEWATAQIVPPKGASMNVKRVMPSYLDTYFDLN